MGPIVQVAGKLARGAVHTEVDAAAQVPLGRKVYFHGLGRLLA